MSAQAGSTGAARERNTPPACPICSRSGSSFYASGTDGLFHKAPGEFSLYRCSSCGSVFQHPMPPQEAISTFYPQEYWWSSQVHSESAIARLLRQLEQSYREFVTKGHVRLLERCARGRNASDRSLLDIGCGNGTFLHLARSRGFIPHGMDISARAVAIARQQYGLDVRQGEIGSNVWGVLRFDLVTMFHVLEHLGDPAAALQFIKTLLAPGGSLIIQVPNAASLQASVFKERWYGLDVPRHIINFTPVSLKLLLERTGFEIQSACRFSLRDNPASLASSLAPGLDPIGRKGRAGAGAPLTEALAEVTYLGLFVAAIPFAWLESLCGRGGTIWVEARKRCE